MLWSYPLHKDLVCTLRGGSSRIKTNQNISITPLHRGWAAPGISLGDSDFLFGLQGGKKLFETVHTWGGVWENGLKQPHKVSLGAMKLGIWELWNWVKEPPSHRVGKPCVGSSQAPYRSLQVASLAGRRQTVLILTRAGRHFMLEFYLLLLRKRRKISPYPRNSALTTTRSQWETATTANSCSPRKFCWTTFFKFPPKAQ